MEGMHGLIYKMNEGKILETKSAYKYIFIFTGWLARTPEENGISDKPPILLRNLLR